MPASLVQGEVLLPAACEPFADATLRVYIEDVTRVDARAQPVAAYELRPIADHEHGIAFAVAVPVLDPRRSYVVRAHVDRSGDGQIAAGDYVSTRSYPVDARSTRVSIEVRLVL